MVAIVDVTERELAVERIAHLAGHDSLTDRPNRQALADTFGHATGDALLRDISARFITAADGGFIARMGDRLVLSLK